MLDKFFKKHRQSEWVNLIHRHDMRAMVRALKNKEVLWIAADQAYKKTGSVYVPFFGVNTSTIETPSIK